jgi:hypothetical protein
MAVDTSDPEIPVALREAFAEALAVFSDWERGDEPKIVFDGRPTAISRVFFWTTGFDDAIPRAVLCGALQCSNRSHDTVELLKDPSYGSAARLLFRLTEAKKDSDVAITHV